MNASASQASGCRACPRECGVDRAAGRLGYCRTDAGLHVGSICLHRGEEPVVGGPAGIANVFFTHCNLQCVYCQNWQISRNRGPVDELDLSLDEVVARLEGLLDAGARAVGFVSPSHCLAQMRAIIDAVEARGRRPVWVFNSNGYDKVEALRDLEDVIDVYLPDLKYLDAGLAARWSDAADYPAAATAAIREMYRQKGSSIRCDADGQIEFGLVIRHLVLPGQVENSRRCLRWIAEELSPAVHLSLLAQYAPTPAVAGDPALGQRLRPEEYAAVVDELERLGFFRGWVQELDSAAAYAPNFKQAHPFE